MKKFLSAISVILFSGAAPAVHSQVIVGGSFDDHVNVTISGSAIETSGSVEVPVTSVVKLRGTSSVKLKPGFHALSGSRFRAFIFVDTDGDGMDDTWEVSHGLNPASNDASGDKDGDGIPNLVEYQLGTNANGGSSNTNDSSNTAALKVHRP